MSNGVDLSKTRPAARRLGWRRHPAAAADLSKWSAFDWCGGRIHVRTASGPHVATIIYPPFSTTHFYLLITGLILTHIPESFNPNLVETQNIILNPKKRVGALLKFRVQETRKTCKIFIEMEEVLGLFMQISQRSYYIKAAKFKRCALLITTPFISAPK